MSSTTALTHSSPQTFPVENRWGCTHCTTTVSRKSDFARHANTHMQDRSAMQYECKFEGCDFTSLQKSNMLSHEERHGSTKRFSCESCEYQSHDKASLVRHCEKIHLSPKSASRARRYNPISRKARNHPRQQPIVNELEFAAPTPLEFFPPTMMAPFQGAFPIEQQQQQVPMYGWNEMMSNFPVEIPQYTNVAQCHGLSTMPQFNYDAQFTVPYNFMTGLPTMELPGMGYYESASSYTSSSSSPSSFTESCPPSSSSSYASSPSSSAPTAPPPTMEGPLTMETLAQSLRALSPVQIVPQLTSLPESSEPTLRFEDLLSPEYKSSEYSAEEMSSLLMSGSAEFDFNF